MIEFEELDEKHEIVMPRGNPVEISELEPFGIPPEDTEALAEKEQILSYVRENYINSKGQKLSEGGEQDEWALVVGRIQPFQRGHGVLCDAAQVAAKNLLFVVGSANVIDERNPFPPEDREIMLRKYFRDQGYLGNVKIIYQDDLGDPPEWGRQILEKAKKMGANINSVISNSETPAITNVFPRLGIPVFEVPMFNRKDNIAGKKRHELEVAGILQPGINNVKLPLK